MIRILELFMVANAIAGIATFLGVRFAWRRSKNKAKRGFDIIRVDKEECPICGEKYPEDEMYTHLFNEHPDELAKLEEQWKVNGPDSGRASPPSQIGVGS